MSHPEQADIARLLQALRGGGVEFVVVGGAAAVLHGAPTTTRDLDIVHRRTHENVERLVEVLADLGALVRDPAGRRLKPERSTLEGPGQLLLSTRLGPLDVLGALHDGRTFEQLLDTSVSMVDGSTQITVVDLETLIEIKTAAGRPKDRLVVPILVALLSREREGTETQ